MSFEYAAEVDVGARKRKQGGINEDSIAVNILEDGHLDTGRSAGVFVIADGAGGEESGEIASYIATVEVARQLTHTLWETRRLGEILTAGPGATSNGHLDKMTVTEPITEKDADWILNRIRSAIQNAHTRLLSTIQELGLENAYTTIVTGVKVSDTLYLGWVGDSRAYVINRHANRDPEERVNMLTRDHSVVGQMVEEGKIDEIEAHVHQKGNQVTRALGGTHNNEPGASTIQVETRQVKLFSDDVVMLTSDGLVDAYVDAPQLHEEYKQADSRDDIEEEILEKAVTEQEIRDVIMEAESLDEAASRFLRVANTRGGKDNLSLVLFQDDFLASSPEYGLPDRTYEGDSVPILDENTIIKDVD